MQEKQLRPTGKKTLCFYFQVHQPYRLSETSFFDEESQEYFEGPKGAKNKDIFEKVAQKCYIPATKLLLKLLKKHPEFRVSFSLSGVFLDQCEEFQKFGHPVIKLFQDVVKTGQAEILCETYHHSLSFLFSKAEFSEQIVLQFQKIKELFGVEPTIFRNTELIYNNEIGEFIRNLGFQGMLAEGWDPHLEWRSPNHVYKAKKTILHPDDKSIAKEYKIHPLNQDLRLLLKNYQLSDDIAFRFSNSEWKEHPLFAEKFAQWVQKTEGEVINLFMDYETLGEHQWEDCGIFEFFEHLPSHLINAGIGFKTPSEVLKSQNIVGEYNVPHFLSWADSERDLSAWLENDIQKSALKELGAFEKMIFAHKNKSDNVFDKILQDFRRLQSSDHLYYMCTKYFQDGDVHKYFSPYKSEHSPYEAFIHFMNTMRKLRKRFEIWEEEKLNNYKKSILPIFNKKQTIL